jgi:hypothetical protein
LLDALKQMTAELTAASANYGELDRRARRLGEWLKVQSHIAAVRTDVDRLNGYVRDALEALKTLEIERSRAKLEAVTAKWDDDCRQRLAELNRLLQRCPFIALPDPNSTAESSIVGWREELSKVQDESHAVFAQDMTEIADGALKAVCTTLDNQGRQLRDWLRDRDNDCRLRLSSEAEELTTYTSRLAP